MAVNTNEFGLVSHGLDRAQIGSGPPVDAKTNIRPQPPPTPRQKHTIQLTVHKTLRIPILHVRHRFRRVKGAIGKRISENSEHSGVEREEHAPNFSTSATTFRG